MHSSASITVVQILPALNMGGVERGTIEFACHLKQQGHRPIIISGGGYHVKRIEAVGIEHIELQVGKKSPFTCRHIPRLRSLFKELHVDIVHARSRLPAWLVYFALRNKPRPPYFVTTLHGLHSVSRYSSVMARGDAVIAVSKTAAAYLQNHFNQYLKSQPAVIYRGVDCDEFNYGHQPDSDWLQHVERQYPQLRHAQKLLLPGRLSALKGFENIIPWLRQSDDNQYLILTAEEQQSEYSKRMVALLKQQGLADKVIWMGAQDNMADLYAYVDLSLSINRKPESFGRTVLESLTVGTPVVGLNHGGVAEILSALFPQGLVPVGDDDALIYGINTILNENPRVKEQTWMSNQQQFAQTLSVYRQLMSGQSC